MILVESCPTQCLCGRRGDSAAPYLETTYEAPGVRGWVYLCRDCIVEIFSLVAAMPLVEHQRIVEGFNANAAKLNQQIATLTTMAEEGARARTDLEELQPTLANIEAERVALNQEIEAEHRKRLDAEQLAAGNITVAGFKAGIADAIERASSVTAVSAPVTPIPVTEGEANAEPQPAARECEECGEPFEPKRADERYCKAACRQRAYRKRKAGEAVPA